MKKYSSFIKEGLTTVIMISHGYLSKELLESAQLIAGEIENIAYLCLEEGDNPEDFKTELKDLYENIPTKKLVLVDLFGGTPSNSYISILNQLSDKTNAVSGMNLPMLLEVITSRNNLDNGELAKVALEAGKESICNINERLLNVTF